jgi:hypothetical protein
MTFIIIKAQGVNFGMSQQLFTSSPGPRREPLHLPHRIPEKSESNEPERAMFSVVVLTKHRHVRTDFGFASRQECYENTRRES